MKTYKAWAIRMGSGKFLSTMAGHVVLFEARRDAREELAEYKGMLPVSCKRWRVARVDVEIREIY